MDAIHLPNAITLPTTFGTPGTPLPPGQVVQALVLELIQSDVFRLQLPQATVDVKTSVPLTPGTTVMLATKGAGPNARLVIYSDDPNLAPSKTNAPAPPPSAATLPALAGKQPVGEAVILRSGPPASAPAQASTPSKLTTEPAIVRDAPPISAARPPDAPILRNVTPQQALGEAMRVAAARQSGLAPLIADVEQVLQAPPANVPAPVRAAAQQVLALRVPLDAALTAADVKQAFVRSGVLFEAKVAGKQTPSKSAAPLPESGAPNSSAAMPAPSGDLKAALIVFRQVLRTWSNETAPVRVAQGAPPASSAFPTAMPAPVRTDTPQPALSDAPTIKHLANVLAGATDELLPMVSSLSPEQATNLAKSVAAALHGREASAGHPGPANNPNAPPPPYRGAPLSAQQPVAPSIMPDTPPHETAERLLAATDGAIARTMLLQAASLPDQQAAPRNDPVAQRWTFEVPFMTVQGAAVAQFEVSRDGRAAREDPLARVWRARFTLDVEPIGPVHALVTLVGARTSVTLWAERAATASKFNDSAAMLSDALRAAELDPGDVQFRVGVPPVIAKQSAPGRFMDRAT